MSPCMCAGSVLIRGVASTGLAPCGVAVYVSVCQRLSQWARAHVDS
jgi:hypothetical protein